MYIIVNKKEYYIIIYEILETLKKGIFNKI